MTKLRANQIEIQEVLNDPAAQATELINGTLRIATQAEVDGGSPYDHTIVVTPETLANWTGIIPPNNWLTANNATDFTNAPSGTGSNSIALGDNASTSFGSNSIAMGTSAVAGTNDVMSIGFGCTCPVGTNGGISLGYNCSIASGFQTSIGYTVTANSITTDGAVDVPYSLKIGYGTVGLDRNLMHLHDKGKLNLHGSEAQFVFPNYLVGSPAAPAIPSTTVEGGTIYDASSNVLKFYNGTAWTALNADNWLHANNGSDFATAPSGTGTDSIALGNNASTSTNYGAVAIGTNVTAAINAVSIGPNSDALGTSSIAIGTYAQTSASGTGVAIGPNANAAGTGSIAVGFLSSTTSQKSIAIGYDSDTGALTNQIAIGNSCKSTSVTTDVTYSVKLGEGEATANLNMLHLFSKGKLELYGDEAQFVFPNYLVGSPATPAIPSTTVEGGAIWDASTKELKIYDGTAFTAIGGGGGGTPGGATTEVQYNNAGAFGGMSEVTYDNATGILDITNASLGSNDMALRVENTNGAIFSYAIDAYAAGGLSTQVAIRGTCNSTSGYGLWGEFSGTGAGRAIYAHATSDTSTGVYAVCNSTTGVTTGVFGQSLSSSGRGGYFENTDGNDTEVEIASASDLITGSVDAVEKFRIDDTGEASFVGNVISHIAINSQVVTEYTLVLADDGKLVTMSNAAPTKLIIPLNASVAFPVGTQILVSQEGAGQTTIEAGGSPPAVTINSAGGFLSLANQYTTITLLKKSTDVWLLIGDLV